MIKRLDHIVILVRDLDQAIVDYRELGFVVTYGGEHRNGETHNALIAFEDGAYLELIAFLRPAPGHRWWSAGQQGREGLVDFALLPSAIEHDVDAARSRGLELQGPFDGGRERPDGLTLRWQIAHALSPELPFLCADITPRELRVPGGEVLKHPNEVTGVAEVVVAVSDRERSVRRYRALLDLAPLGPTPNGDQQSPEALLLGETTIALQSSPSRPDSGDPAPQPRLATHGEGIWEVVLRAPAGTQPLSFYQPLAHGARLRRVPADR